MLVIQIIGCVWAVTGVVWMFSPHGISFNPEVMVPLTSLVFPGLVLYALGKRK